ncbi:hypothetical protein AAIA72_13000 [Hahella sp. SMD15-11]|uniref:Uncharacterized protein n=1 Tax=Thermohahella caldifontis TaxID=3142973 RepID=A0AB39UV96_9GAMM
MSLLQPKYPLKDPLPKIEDPDHLPEGARLLAIFEEQPDKYYYYFVQRGDKLLFLDVRKNTPLGLLVHQKVFPLRVLSWFPKALEAFGKPPAEGGLHAGAMMAPAEDVDGEMLAVGSTIDGYDITNFSRSTSTHYYNPASIALTWEQLYEMGLLELWKSLGEKYEKGDL